MDCFCNRHVTHNYELWNVILQAVFVNKEKPHLRLPGSNGIAQIWSKIAVEVWNHPLFKDFKQTNNPAATIKEQWAFMCEDYKTLHANDEGFETHNDLTPYMSTLKVLYEAKMAFEMQEKEKKEKNDTKQQGKQHFTSALLSVSDGRVGLSLRKRDSDLMNKICESQDALRQENFLFDSEELRNESDQVDIEDQNDGLDNTDFKSGVVISSQGEKQFLSVKQNKKQRTTTPSTTSSAAEISTGNSKKSQRQIAEELEDAKMDQLFKRFESIAGGSTTCSSTTPTAGAAPVFVSIQDQIKLQELTNAAKDKELEILKMQIQLAQLTNQAAAVANKNKE